MAWDQITTLPPWMNPRETPMDSLVKGVQAGSMISQAWNRRTELGMEAEKQAVMIPLQIESAALRSEAQRVNLAEQQIGLNTMQQEIQFQKDDLSGFQQYVQTLAATPAGERGNVVAPAFMSTKYNTQAAQINRTVQDSQAVKAAQDAQRNYDLANMKWYTQITDEAAAVQGLLPAGSPQIITPNPKGGLPIINQALLNEGKRLQLEEKRALVKQAEIKPYMVDGKPLFYYTNNPTTGAVNYLKTPTEPVDKATDMELTSLHKQANHAQQSIDNIKSGQTKPEDKTQALIDLQNTLNGTNRKIKEAVERRRGNVAPPSRSQAINAPKVDEIRRGYKYLGGDPAKSESWQKVQP